MKYNLVLIAAVSMTLGGCFDGGSNDGASNGGSTPTAVVNSGQAVDGYLTGATAFYDANNNGRLDAGEPSATTDAQGRYSLSTTGAQPITVIGGRNADTGLDNASTLKAPAGSSFVTPLTTLIASGTLSAAQLQSALGLGSTDVTKTDPMAAGNTALLAKTLAMQQIMQESADMLAALGGSDNQQTREQLYSLAAKAMAAELTKGAVNLSDATAVKNLTSATLKSTKQNAENSSNTDAGLKTALQGLNADSVAALAAPIIASQASTVAGDPTQVKAVQSNESATGMAVVLKDYLTGTTTVDKLAAIADAVASGATPTTIVTIVNSQLGTSIPVEVIADATALNDYLAIRDDTVTVNGIAHTLAQFEAGQVSVTAPVTSLQFHVNVQGNPVPLNTPTVVSLGLEVSSPTDSRRLQMIIDKAQITVTEYNGIKFASVAAVPTGANLYVFGRNAQGLEANAVLQNAEANVIDSNCSCFSWNPNQALLNVANALGKNNPVFSELQTIHGTFNVTMNISNVRVARKDASGQMVLANPYEIKVKQAGADASVKSVFGYGAQGKLTIQ